MDLKEKLGEELYNQVNEKLGDDTSKLIINDNGSYIPKARFDEVNTQKTELNKQLTDIQKKVKALGPLAEDNEELKKQVTNLGADIETNQTKYKANTKKMTLDFAIKTAISYAKPATEKSAKAIFALLDTSKISLDGDNLMGIDDQLNDLKENEAHFFGTVRKQGNEPDPGLTSPPGEGKYGGYDTKTEYSEKNPKGYAKDYPDGY